jgi:conjugal transfer mating pair stabilization protein TraG
MLEVFTIGGGEYIVNVFNAVAAWTGGGGYKSLIRVVMVMGLIYTLLIVAFNLDWRAWMNWFLQSTLIYLCLMVPTASVKVMDRINPSLAPSTIANVPLGLGVVASFTSKIGDYLTTEAETVFIMPAQLQYSNNGMIYGAKLMEATRQLRITDPLLASNINEYMKRCVFYDVLLGFKSMSTLADAPDLWTAIGPGSPARAQSYTVLAGPGTTTSIITCQDAYTALTPAWAAYLNTYRPRWAKTLFPELGTAADAKLMSDLPATYNAFTGNASSALNIMRQHLAINAFTQARDDMAGGTGSASIDSFAATRADIQTRNTYSAIAQSAMKWVPILNIVLTVVFYAMFPVLFPLFLMPKTGIGALRGYVTGFFYLAAWGPLYVVLHMILMSRGLAAGAAVSSGGVTLGSFAGIGAVNEETATLAGYMISTVPFLAAGMAKGAMAIASQATSFLAPSQNAAEAAALEATTGNYAYGNASLANQTVNTQSRDQWNTAPTFNGAAGPSVAFRQANGTMSTINADGTSTVNQTPGISSFEWKPSLTRSDTNEMRETLGDFKNQATQQRELASQSLSAANTIGSQIFSTAQNMRGSDTITGRQSQESISQAQNLTRSWSDSLVNNRGWERSAADAVARQAYINGTGNLGLSSPIPGLGAGIGVSVLSQQERNRSTGESVNERIAKDLAFLNAESTSDVANSSRESFFRAVSTSGSSELSGLTQRRDASLTEARGHSLEAGRLDEAGQRYEKQVSEIESGAYQTSRDYSQDWQTFASSELARNPSLAASGYQTWMRNADLNPSQRAARDVLEVRFSGSIVNAMRQDLAPIAPLSSSGITSPSRNVSGWGGRQIDEVTAQRPATNIVADSRDPGLSSLVSDRIDGANARMDFHQRDTSFSNGEMQRRGDALSQSVTDVHQQSLGSTMPLVNMLTGGGDSIPLANGPVNTMLPSRGDGFRTYGRDKGGENQVGTAAFVGELQNIGAEWSARGNGRVSYGEMSQAGGGPMAGHEGHQSGREVDIRPFRTDGRNLPTQWNDPKYDRDATREFVQMVRQRDPSATVLFNDPQLIREGLTQRWDGHDNHLHLRLGSRPRSRN